MLFPKNKKPSWPKNANWAVPVLAEFVKGARNQSSNRRRRFPSATTIPQRAGKSQ
jgi:hypothetical protein